MAGTTSIGGVLSGMQTEELIKKIVDLERKPIERLELQQASLKTKMSAYQEVNTRLNALEEAAAELSLSSFFSSRTVTVSDDRAMTATAELGATPGEYSVTVDTVARAHQVRSQSYASLDSASLGTGTLSITAGGQTTTIAVDSSNNTLSGIRTAINNANTNIRASIIQDGDSSYRLLISSKSTGTANALTIHSTLSGGTDPVFADLQPAQDAQIRLGSGADAITVTRSTNAVRDLIPGVTLNLLKADPDTPLTVSVGQDTTKIVAGVQKLVDQYNNAVEFLNAQSKFDLDSGTSGALLGDQTLRNVQAELADLFSQGVGGLSGLDPADVGIETTGTGKLSLNALTLQEKLETDPESVRQLFALTANSTHTGVQFVSAGQDSVAAGTAFAVEITQAARQARVTAGAALSAPLDADETLTVNGVEIQLTSGMTQSEVIQAINARSSETKVTVSGTAADGTGTGDTLTFTTAAYGSKASVSIVSSRSSGSGSTSGIGNVAATHASPGGESGSGTGDVGLDVAGTINGEPATGAGQMLTGNDGNAHTGGLRLRITAGTTGPLGTVALYEGVARAGERILNRLTDLVDGPIIGEQESLEQRIKDLQEIITKREEAITRKEEALRRQFNAMEAALAEFEGQAQYLQSSLGNNQQKK